jgi:hypothetical protein
MENIVETTEPLKYGWKMMNGAIPISAHIHILTSKNKLEVMLLDFTVDGDTVTVVVPENIKMVDEPHMLFSKDTPYIGDSSEFIL